MTNLALKTTNGEVVQFPKKEQQIMSKKDDGYTPLPNFICDEGYLAVLDGDAIKCLVLLNRHINGFHIEEKSMGEALVMKITGIKDNRTIRKVMTKLADFKLIKIEKQKGKTNTYSISFDERISPTPVASDVPSTSNAGTFHATTPVASDVPATSDMACHSVKEIDLKENIKINTQESVCEKTWQPNRQTLQSLLAMSGLGVNAQNVFSLPDYEFQLKAFNAHFENKILSDNQLHTKFCVWIKDKYTQYQSKQQREQQSLTKPEQPTQTRQPPKVRQIQYGQGINLGDSK